MEPITTALVAGASIVFKDLAGEFVKDAYKGLRTLLAGRLSSLQNLEEDPTDEDYVKATSKEIQKKGLSEDQEVLAKASALAKAVESEPNDRLAAGNIDIGRLKAAQDIIVKRLSAAGDVIVKDIDSSGGKIEVEGISAGVAGKN